jgi:hypothetical protein
MPTWRWPKLTRDSIIFATGIFGIVHEAFIRNGDVRTELLLLFATMCGLPVFLRADERQKAEDVKPVDG